MDTGSVPSLSLSINHSAGDIPVLERRASSSMEDDEDAEVEEGALLLGDGDDEEQQHQQRQRRRVYGSGETKTAEATTTENRKQREEEEEGEGEGEEGWEEKHRVLFALLAWPLTLKEQLYDGRQLTPVQLHIWAFVIGALGGLVIYAYYEVLHYGLKLVWHIIPHALFDHTPIFGDRFPRWNYIWIASMIMGTMVGICSWLWTKFSFFKLAGTMPDMINKLHLRGYIGTNHLIPMFVTSLISIISGGSCGPEAAVIIIGGAVGSKVGKLLNQRTSTLRVLTLCGMSAGLSAFFGLPLGGAIFVLELPHRMGLQFYEAITPTIISSLIAVLIKKGLTMQDLGGNWIFPGIKQAKAVDMLKGVVLGAISALIGIVFIYIAHLAKWLFHEKLKLHQRPIFAGAMAGAIIGLTGMLWPETLFWSELEMQTILDRGRTPLPNIPSWLGSVAADWGWGKVPYNWHLYFQISAIKALVTIVAIVGGYPGGVIYPLFFVGAAFGYGFSLLVDSEAFPATLCILCFMGGIEVAITRTPWATSIVLLQLQAGFEKYSDNENESHFVSLFSVLSTAVCTSLFLTRSVKYYSAQRNRSDALIIRGEARMYEDDFDEQMILNDKMLHHDEDDDEDEQELREKLRLNKALWDSGGDAIRRVYRSPSYYSQQFADGISFESLEAHLL
ncbi:hypothetical protein QOT17_004058 [Balamuthia mandrillaris]